LRYYSAQPQHDSEAVFDSSNFDEVSSNTDGVGNGTPIWDSTYRDRVNSQVFGENVSYSKIFTREEEKKKKKKKKAAALAKVLLGGSTDEDEDKDIEAREVKEEDQKSLSVAIIGAPNAGKSSLTNFMVGSKVSAVSRKINTTTNEILGVLTKGDTQVCLFDTPGLMLKKSGFPYSDIKIRNESAWSSVNLYDVLIVIFDVHRHITRPDSRVVRLIERMGSDSSTNQKRILCLNKIDLVEKKSELNKALEKFKDLPGYEKHFLVSGMKGTGVRDLVQHLLKKAVKRPWDEDPLAMSEEFMKNISLEVVRERLLDYVHQEIPYTIEHRLMDWRELHDGSLRIEQHFITNKVSQRKILVGKNGSKIGRIGLEANEELRLIFKRRVHLILMVRVK
ncbi:hypothetical protein M569_02487, partial [Genlisea aurea]